MIHSGSLRWGKVACDLTSDERLDRDHYRIYIRMAGSVKRGSNISNIGQRRLAEKLGISQMTVGRRQAELQEWGHIKPQERKHGQRGYYEMLSPVFLALPKKSAPAARAKSTGGGVRSAARAWAAVQDERRKETA